MDSRLMAMQEYIRGAFADSGAHGFDHTLRVTKLCVILGTEEGAEMQILIPAALFHDIARPIEDKTGIPHEEKGAELAEAYLRSIHYPDVYIPGILHAIRAHRYRSSDVTPETLEAKVLSDADKLDAMGAVGIARTFMQAGEERGGISDAVHHINEKLLKLKDRMHTEAARKIAVQRHAFLKEFLEILQVDIQADSEECSEKAAYW
ncbi:phosphohydrolase [Methanocalculus chunghsingensis]|uniref:Phosphohydrolase n=1 Tax=Methanocalculus chunghsingensis TaxID=156457 RepID=A0A8J8B4Z6_9EURY|nr:HD domain-containing protein [Methanocalculus chunghsingensis]MBR1369221.1 phosphohydrolase [Methanocalculus chunghsingensis]